MMVDLRSDFSSENQVPWLLRPCSSATFEEELGAAIARASIAVIDYYNPLKLDLQGASGGPLLTDRSEFVGTTYVFDGTNRPSAIKTRRATFRDFRRDSAGGTSLECASDGLE
jgi:hypothetical protein